jgi:hypothetical protein
VSQRAKQHRPSYPRGTVHYPTIAKEKPVGLCSISNRPSLSINHSLFVPHSVAILSDRRKSGITLPLLHTVPAFRFLPQSRGYSNLDQSPHFYTQTSRIPASCLPIWILFLNSLNPQDSQLSSIYLLLETYI